MFSIVTILFGLALSNIDAIIQDCQPQQVHIAFGGERLFIELPCFLFLQ